MDRMSELYEHIGKTIRELRQTYPDGALSQEALANRIGITANTLSRWETGTYKPTPEDLDKLARFFCVSITVFFPSLQQDQQQVQALASATAGFKKNDFDEVIRYAEYRKARLAMENAKRRGGKK
jgi:transcriptional regulator with XRE-family HTH domain